MVDKKTFLEHTKIFENVIIRRLDEGLNNMKELISNTDYTSPMIYTCVLNSVSDYDYFLSKMVKEEDYNIYSQYLSSVYISIPYYELLEISNNIYVGEFIVGDEKYRFEYILEQDTRYFDKIVELYKSFVMSNFKWWGIDMADILRMYRVKVISYIDDISLIENMDFKISYGLNSNFSFSSSIYWNIIETVNIVKPYISVLDNVAYRYDISKELDSNYLVKEVDLVEDIINYQEYISVYSKHSNIYSLELFKICPFDTRLIKDYRKSLPIPVPCVITLEKIKTYLKSYGISVKNIYKSSENKSHLIIPNYNKHIHRIYTSYIYIEITGTIDYFALFLAINILQLEISLRIRVYEV